ncbi:MAG: alpha/beta hydrolase [Planctomycetota bacterium]
MKKSILPFILIILYANCSYALTYSTVQKNISYGPHERNVLDIYYPVSVKKPLAVLIYIHGGGFTGGKKKLTLNQRLALGKGMAAVSINYRLVQPQGITALDSMKDAARAIQFLRFNADKYGIELNHRAFDTGVSSARSCDIE